MSNPHAQYETDHVSADAQFGFSTEAGHSLEMSEGKPTLEEIAREAYAIYLANGSQDGRDFDDWLEAERRLIAQHRPSMALNHDALVQHGNGESRQRSARPVPDRRRAVRPSVPTYLPV
jgi:hypothetical protein